MGNQYEKINGVIRRKHPLMHGCRLAWTPFSNNGIDVWYDGMGLNVPFTIALNNDTKMRPSEMGRPFPVLYVGTTSVRTDAKYDTSLARRWCPNDYQFTFMMFFYAISEEVTDPRVVTFTSKLWVNGTGSGATERWRCQFQPTGTTRTMDFDNPQSVLRLGNWQSIATTIDIRHGISATYMNGHIQNDTDAYGTNELGWGTNDDITIGNRHNNNLYTVEGEYESLFTWERPLSEQEILAMHNEIVSGYQNIINRGPVAVPIYGPSGANADARLYPYRV